MRQYLVTGMSCAACSARVEQAVSKLAGVDSCSVNLLTNSMGVEGTASDQEIIRAVQDAGYGASSKDGGDAAAPAVSSGEEALADRETPVLRRRLIASLGFLLALMYFSMGHVMWGWPLPGLFSNNPAAVGLAQLLLAAVVMLINQKFFRNGWKGLLHRAPNMDTLVALGSGASFVYSVCALFVLTEVQTAEGAHAAHTWLHELYFESAAMILALITVGKLLEARAKGRTTDALKSLMGLAPKTAAVLREGVEIVIPVEQVKRGEVFVVRPGESIPVDGVVLEGESAVNEAALTGESIPVDKAPGDSVSAAAINQSGFLRCQATRVGEDTTLAKIIQLVGDAAATKAPIARIADKVSGVFVPVVISLAVITVAAWLLLGESVGYALARGISILVISCPCALGLATPVAIMVGSGMGAKNGVLFKTAVSLEELGRVQIVALDKTGTITTGDPAVTELLPAPGVEEETLLSLACTLEGKSEHPLARAILREAQRRGIAPAEAEGFQALPGSGLTARLEGTALYGGNLRFISSKASVPDQLRIQADRLAEEGKTPLYFSRGGELLGIIAVADQIKEDSAQAVRELQGMGIRVVMLTGDNVRTAKAIGTQAGVDHVTAGVLPEGKERVIRALREKGKVVMVGDGINDAPALTRADVGVAIGAGTDVAIDAADVVLMKSALTDVPAAIRLSRQTLRNIRQNLFWAFFYNAVCIPLAAGAFAPLGLTITPMIGAAAMSLSSFCVVTNALRLNLFRMHEAGRDTRIQPVEDLGLNFEVEENTAMKKTMSIEGMMCGHCEARVKKTLEGLSGVESAEVSHQKGTAVVTLQEDIADDVLKKAVEDQDYKVVSISE